MGPNPNAFCCGFPSGLAQVTVQVTTSNPLSRHHPCRDIDLTSRHGLKSLQLSTGVTHDVATSISCRDINLCLWKLHWLFFGVATSVLCRDNSLSHSSFIFSNFSCLDLHSLSRHQPLSRHHCVVATSFLKPLVNPQLPNL